MPLSVPTHDGPFDVTWGMGGPDRTIRCGTRDAAQEIYRTFRAWGTVLAQADQCPWQRHARQQATSSMPGWAVLSGQLYPILPIVHGHPRNDPYSARHAHLHRHCGHVSECSFADRGQPCQAAESLGDLCRYCELND